MTRRPSPYIFLLLVALSLAPSFSMHGYLPALPAIQAGLGVSTGLVQLTLSLAMVSVASMTLVYGPISDRYGRRPAILLGMGVFLTGSVVCMLAADVWTLIVGRILQTGGASAGMVLSRTITRDIYGAADTARLLSYLIMSTVVGSTIGPAIGGLLTDQFGWRSIFVAVTIYGGVIATAAFFLLRETNPLSAEERASSRLLDGFKRLLRIPTFWGYALISAFAMAVFFCFLAVAPYLMADVLGQPARAYGFWFAAISLAFVAGNYLSTRLMHRHHIVSIIGLGVLWSLVPLGGGAIAMAILPLTPLLLFTPAIFLAFVQGLVISNGMAGAMNVDAKAAGAAAGMTSFLQMAISAGFAQIVGVLEDGTVWPMMGAMTVATIGSFFALWLLRITRAAEDGTAG